MLSSLSRLCTCYLQSHGFSCGIDDMLLIPTTEANRKKMLATANDATHRAAEEFAYAGVAPVGEKLRPSATVREQLESRLRERQGCVAVFPVAEMFSRALGCLVGSPRVSPRGFVSSMAVLTHSVIAWTFAGRRLGST